MTTTTELGFIRDIIEHPEADDLRLIYADFLDDHGEEERAEFIRVQVELAQHPLCLSAYPGEHLLYPYCAGCRTVHRLYPRMEDLWYLPASGSGFTEESSRGLALTIGGAIPDCQIPQLLFRRGFVAEVHAPLAVLEQYLPALVRQHPIERVQATDREPLRLRDHSLAKVRWCRDHQGVLVGTNLDEGQYLPLEVWRHLPEDMDKDKPSTHLGLDYPTAEAAYAALSIALLTLARE